jgi:mannose-6-phosphate isomerase-like protein (cupin superfamily)
MTDMIQPVSEEDAASRGIRSCHSRMPNGEYRFRLQSQDGSCYVRTEASERGAWQNSHLHRHTYELYVVQSGWMAVAEQRDDIVSVRIYRRNESCRTEPGVPHNVYLSAHTVLHTVKYGDCPQSDWIPCEALDVKTKPMTEEAIRAIGA